MIEAGHGYGGLETEITWFGWIHVTAVDLSEAGKDFRRHMMGDGREDGWCVLARASGRVDKLLAAREAANPCAGRGPGNCCHQFAPGC